MQQWPSVRGKGWRALAPLVLAGSVSAAWAAPATPGAADDGATAAAPAGAESAEATATAILDEVVEELWLRSDHYWHTGDYETTSRCGRLVLRLDPKYVEAVTTVAWLLRQGLSRPQQALAVYHRGIRANPGSYEVPFDLGFTYYDMKQYGLAAHYLRMALTPDAPPPVHHLLAHAYERLGRPDDALKVWRATVQQFPKDLAGRRNLERLEKEIEEGTAGQKEGNAPRR